MLFTSRQISLDVYRTILVSLSRGRLGLFLFTLSLQRRPLFFPLPLPPLLLCSSLHSETASRQRRFEMQLHSVWLIKFLLFFFEKRAGLSPLRVEGQVGSLSGVNELMPTSALLAGYCNNSIDTPTFTIPPITATDSDEIRRRPCWELFQNGSLSPVVAASPKRCAFRRLQRWMTLC